MNNSGEYKRRKKKKLILLASSICIIAAVFAGAVIIFNLQIYVPEPFTEFTVQNRDNSVSGSGINAFQLIYWDMGYLHYGNKSSFTEQVPPADESTADIGSFLKTYQPSAGFFPELHPEQATQIFSQTEYTHQFITAYRLGPVSSLFREFSTPQGSVVAAATPGTRYAALFSANSKSWPMKAFNYYHHLSVITVPALDKGKQWVLFSLGKSGPEHYPSPETFSKLLESFWQQYSANDYFVFIGDISFMAEKKVEMFPVSWQFSRIQSGNDTRNLDHPFSRSESHEYRKIWCITSPNVRLLDMHAIDLKYRHTYTNPVIAILSAAD